jgi:hypothetical protein
MMIKSLPHEGLKGDIVGSNEILGPSGDDICPVFERDLDKVRGQFFPTSKRNLQKKR